MVGHKPLELVIGVRIPAPQLIQWRDGRVWFMAAALKAVELVRVPWVRILLSPQWKQSGWMRGLIRNQVSPKGFEGSSPSASAVKSIIDFIGGDK